MPFTQANAIITELKEKLGLNEKIYAVIKIWEQELGSLSQDIMLTGIKGKILLVEAASSTHLQEIALRRRELINKINQYFGGERVIKEIKISLKK